MLDIFKAIVIVVGLLILIPLALLLIGMVIAVIAGLGEALPGEALLVIFFVIVTIVCLVALFKS